MRHLHALAVPLVAVAALPLRSSTALAHVKWFAPFIVGAPPQPVSAVMGNSHVWFGVALVLFFFVITRLIEVSRFGEPLLGAMDWTTGPLWRRLDDFVVAMIAAFFVAIFAVGGIYLTPDLKAPAEWVSWIQLLIAICAFSRKTMPLAAAGIVGLWLLALHAYELFHLLDYLALGLGAAGYLLLASRNEGPWYERRFAVLRWAVAISLMWSSLEKFAYPDWFYPLVAERPFLTFGLPRDMFIPMAGVAEFTLGFGLLWTPLIRRLSAIALFVIFNAAVYPFGRIDLIGHALIMAMLVTIIADHGRAPAISFSLRRSIAAIPAGLATALVVFALSYWGLHGILYSGATAQVAAAHETHSPDPDHPHGTEVVCEDGKGAPHVN